MKAYYRKHGITLYHGDATKILPRLPARSIDFVFTDPPYGNTDAKWDNPVQLEFVFNQLRRLQSSEHTAHVITACGSFLPRALSIKNPPFRYDLVWNKGVPCGYLNAFFTIDSRGIFQSCGAGRFSVLEMKKVKSPHPTGKPVALCEWMVRTFTRRGDVVLDCFAGGGSTLVACKRLGRQAIGIELEKRFCRMAAERLEAC